MMLLMISKMQFRFLKYRFLQITSFINSLFDFLFTPSNVSDGVICIAFFIHLNLLCGWAWSVFSSYHSSSFNLILRLQSKHQALFDVAKSWHSVFKWIILPILKKSILATSAWWNSCRCLIMQRYLVGSIVDAFWSVLVLSLILW